VKVGDWQSLQEDGAYLAIIYKYIGGLTRRDLKELELSETELNSEIYDI